MKYMIEWTVRTQTTFSKWKPEKGLTVLAFVGNVAGRSGYVLVEASDPEIVASFATKFGYWNDIDVVPVIDIGDLVAISAPNIAWARAASKGLAP
jgi:hypothetical protein